jgi:hypothetical protein
MGTAEVVVVRDQQRLHRSDIFRAQPEIAGAALFPGERDRAQAIDEIQASNERSDVGFIPEA